MNIIVRFNKAVNSRTLQAFQIIPRFFKSKSKSSIYSDCDLAHFDFAYCYLVSPHQSRNPLAPMGITCGFNHKLVATNIRHKAVHGRIIYRDNAPIMCRNTDKKFDEIYGNTIKLADEVFNLRSLDSCND